MKSSFSWEIFRAMPMICILRNYPASITEQVLALGSSAGLHTVEITMNTPGAEKLIEGAVKKYGDRMNIGAGTVRNDTELEKALAAGAQFIVSPNTVPSIIERCRDQKIPVFPGALTPTEIHLAWECGADMIKLFPVSTFGPGYLRELRGPFDQIPLLAVGGINLENMADYRAAGAQGFGVASLLYKKDLIAREDWNGLETHFKKVADQCRALFK